MALDVAGATGASFIASAGGQLTVLATASNNQGEDSRESAAVTVSPALEAPRVMEARVSPEGGEVGQDFTAVVAAAGVPSPALSFQWLRAGVAIGGATGVYHTATAEGPLSVMVTATNPEGSASVESAPVVVAMPRVAPVVKSVFVSPQSGQVGDVFTATALASGEPVPTLSYQWLLDGAAIPGATATSFVADAEGELGVVVTAENLGGLGQPGERASRRRRPRLRQRSPAWRSRRRRDGSAMRSAPPSTRAERPRRT